MPAHPPLLLRSATVVDTRDGSLHPETDVLIPDGVIAAVGRGLAVPDGTTVVDAHGRYLVPGYNDMHAHPLGRGGDVAAALRLMLAHGITGYRQMSGDLGLLHARASGRLNLPRESPALLAMPGPLLTTLNTATAGQAAARSITPVGRLRPRTGRREATSCAPTRARPPASAAARSSQVHTRCAAPTASSAPPST
ncbi:hypothetical protein GCM10022252_70000 [Streptosporangium oxazolinicum]|uniref:Amidohydrolase 3 domain-containing protein n=1 Tax=Streptosporangium oxazolinicum TaxID=909287 RepID=A0ABP8BHF0_9ACTN